MSDAINAALRAAEAAAAETPAPASTMPAPATAAPLPAAAPAAPRSLMDFMESASMNVDAWLGVSDLGIRAGKDKQLHDTIDVEMCFADAKAGFVIRCNTPGGVKYLTSYDGVIEAKSRQNWQAVLADAQRMDGNAYPSDLIELPVRLLHEVKRKENGPLAAGTIVGLSLSYMNAKAFGAFLKEQFPKVGRDGRFKVRLSAVAKKGSGQDYGVFGYEVLPDAPAKAGKAA